MSVRKDQLATETGQVPFPLESGAARRCRLRNIPGRLVPRIEPARQWQR